MVGSASGLFFRHKEIKYLVTNRHVVLDEAAGFMPTSLVVTLHQGRKDLTKNIVVQISLYKGSVPLWKQHPSYEKNRCDVVLLPLNPLTLRDKNFDFFNSASIIFMGSDIINDKQLNPFGDVVVIGYPLGFHDVLHNLPVYRQASIASAYGVNFNGLPYFLIDANLHNGTSGSPVVASHHTLFRERGREEGYVLFGVHSAEHAIDENPLGLNVVWYADVLVEIAES